MRGKYRITEYEAFRLELSIQEKIETKAKKRRAALERAGGYDTFPERIRKYYLSLELATQGTRSPQERTDEGNVLTSAERDSGSS